MTPVALRPHSPRGGRGRAKPNACDERCLGLRDIGQTGLGETDIFTKVQNRP